MFSAVGFYYIKENHWIAKGKKKQILQIKAKQNEIEYKKKSLL